MTDEGRVEALPVDRLRPNGARVDARDGSGQRSGFRGAVGWSMIAVGGQQLLTAISGFVLAAIVGPEAFGTIAMAMVYVMFVQLLVRQGIVQAVVQREELTSEHVDAAFWMVLSSSILLTVGSIAVSGPWAAANRLPDLQVVIIALSPLVIVQGLVVVQESLLRRSMNFRALALRTLIASTAGGILGVGLALAGAGVWALVAQQLSVAVLQAIVLWSVSEWRPRMKFELKRARELLGFSTGASLAGLGSFLNAKGDALLIGLFFGPLPVGLYRLAARLTEMIGDFCTRSIGQVALPHLSRALGDRMLFRRRAISTLRTTSVITVPLLGVLAGSSREVMAIFGDEWADARTALILLCAVTAIRSVMLIDATIINAAGRPFANAAFVWYAALVSVAAFVLVGWALRDRAIEQQVTGIALSRLVVTAVLLLPAQLVLLKRVAGISVGHSLLAMRSPVVSGLVAAVVGVAVGSWGTVLSMESNLVRLASTTLASLLAALVALWILDRSLLSSGRSLVSGRRDIRTSTGSSVERSHG